MYAVSLDSDFPGGEVGTGQDGEILAVGHSSKMINQ